MEPAPPRVRARGAFTLFELMIALALAVALAAVVLPVSMSWLPAAGLEEAGVRVETALALARAEAQRRGVVIEVVAVAAENGVTELRSREVRPEEEVEFEAEADAVAAEPVTTLLAELPAGTNLRRGRSPEEGGPGPDEEIAPEGEVESESAELVIAIALPDGRIVAEGGGGLRAIGADGRRAALEINGWTGAVTSRPGVEAAEESEDRPPEDPAEAT